MQCRVSVTLGGNLFILVVLLLPDHGTVGAGETGLNPPIPRKAQEQGMPFCWEQPQSFA